MLPAERSSMKAYIFINTSKYLEVYDKPHEPTSSRYKCVYISYYPTHGTTLFRKVFLLLFWSRLVHAAVEMHATLVAFGPISKLPPLYVPASPVARAVACKPCPVVLVPDSTVGCSRLPARNLHLSSREQSQGPCVGFKNILRSIQVEMDIDYSRGRDAPRSPSLARHRLRAGHREGLLRGRDVERQRGGGRSSGCRESQLFFGYIITKNIFKDSHDMTTTTTTNTI